MFKMFDSLGPTGSLIRRDNPSNLKPIKSLKPLS